MKPATNHPERSGDQTKPGEVERDNDALHGNESDTQKDKPRNQTAAQSAARDQANKPSKP